MLVYSVFNVHVMGRARIGKMKFTNNILTYAPLSPSTMIPLRGRWYVWSGYLKCVYDWPPHVLPCCIRSTPVQIVLGIRDTEQMYRHANGYIDEGEAVYYQSKARRSTHVRRINRLVEWINTTFYAYIINVNNYTTMRMRNPSSLVSLWSITSVSQ